MRTYVDKTVSYTPKIDLKAVGINTLKVLYVYAAYPEAGVSLGSVETGNVFQLAADLAGLRNELCSKTNRLVILNLIVYL